MYCFKLFIFQVHVCQYTIVWGSRNRDVDRRSTMSHVGSGGWHKDLLNFYALLLLLMVAATQ